MKVKHIVCVLSLVSVGLVSPWSLASASQDESVEIVVEEGFAADGHHMDHQIQANFLPEKILNPDDSLYEAPEAVKDYVGLYEAQAQVPSLNSKIDILVSVTEDGLFNLAYYFTNEGDQQGIRFYSDDQENIQSTPAPYKDLVLMTGALTQIEGQDTLSSGLIRKTMSPVVLLDKKGQFKDFYPYLSMAYDLRDTYANARVYQYVGLQGAEKKFKIDVNYMIGLKDQAPLEVELKKVDKIDSLPVLVAKPTYQIMQDSFDNYLMDNNDFKFQFNDWNEFVQIIQAMHLKTNASFPVGTEFVKVDPNNVNLPIKAEPAFALLINNKLLYYYDGEKLYLADQFQQEGDRFVAKKWITNR